MEKIRITTKKEYDVVIGSGTINEIQNYVPKKRAKVLLLTDDRVKELYAVKVASKLEAMGMDVFEFDFPHGEEHKSMATYQSICEFLAVKEFAKDDYIYALGGGVTTDLGGFVAATYKRGLNLVNIPTTITGAIDAAIGGKNGINLNGIKNIVGTIMQPNLVLIDIDFFDTLRSKDYISGCAEIIKTAFIGDRELLEVLSNRPLTANKTDKRYVEHIVFCAAGIKANLVSQDEDDKWERHVLNFGHTFGHAIEAKSGYRLSHGEAVAMGMVMISNMAMENSFMKESDLILLEDALIKHGLLIVSPFSRKELIPIIEQDKKVKGDNIDIVVPMGSGRCQVQKIPKQIFYAEKLR